ncbi:hypothetical protein SAMN06265348_11442 [Pedobacter westerhofensis]|uniref:Uncharacterized protein n=1 Tax=Pedobacter westerhofensis TaxID=425512 RepID=A0A521FMI7_9SPHI|nr:hypothetical protein [Pedobacter westerhofensis]SMO97382.1 hypothetical protein SAMN06265348_11442 [Pedobacter westerhofensis]
MQVYTSSKTPKSIVLILCSLGLLGLGYLLTMLLLHHTGSGHRAVDKWFAASFILLFILFIIYIALESCIATLNVGDDSIRFAGAIKRWELKFSDIKGYRHKDKYLLIEPLSKDGKRIGLRLSQPGTIQLIDLLKSRFDDLDLREREEEHKNILDDLRYGKTIAERAEKLEDATGASKLINAIGVMILLLSFILKIEKYTVAVAISAPIVFIIILRIYKGLIRIGTSKSSPYPSIPFGLAAVIICLIIKCFRYSIMDYHHVWQPALLVAIVLVVILMVANKSFSRISESRIMGIVLIMICSFLYGFCTVVCLNCVYDTSNSRYYQARVLDKWVSNGRTKAYHFKISQWREGGDTENIQVSRQMFDRINIEDPMNVYLYEGRLKIPWYVITDQ